jgi:hypothetical protein
MRKYVENDELRNCMSHVDVLILDQKFSEYGLGGVVPKTLLVPVRLYQFS